MNAEIKPQAIADGDAVTTDDSNDGGAQGNSGPNAEAARYRVKLREAEAERDRLAGVVDKLQRSIVDQVAEDAGIKPDALWASGVQVADLFVDGDGDDGAGVIDRDKVNAAVDAARDKFGITQSPRRPLPDPLLGQDQGEPRPDPFLNALSGRGQDDW